MVGNLDLAYLDSVFALREMRGFLLCLVQGL